MATIKYYIGAIILLCVSMSACTKYGYIDGGLSKGEHDCTMWEYFNTDSYNWDSTMLMIERAGLKSLFDGTGEHEQITFFGVTNLSIRRFILNHNTENGLTKDDPEYWNAVSDIPVEKCQDIIEKLVAPRRLMVNDVPRGTRKLRGGGVGSEYVQDGGMDCPCIRGSLFVWTQKGDYGGVKEGGGYVLYIAGQSRAGLPNDQIASGDIQTNNGVVHSLNYDFRFDNF